MLVKTITDHVEAGVAWHLSQYARPRFEGMLRILLRPIQDLENALFALDAGRQLANAQGAQLDGIADLVGISRNGASDNVLRALIGGAISLNNSDTTHRSISNAVAAMYQAKAVQLIDASAPGGQMGRTASAVIVQVGSPQTDQAFYPTVQRMLADSLGAGIGLAQVNTFDASGAFAFAGPQDWVRGFGDVNNSASGGPLGSVSYTNPVL